jgi:predicted site-specific integrase-resolvase
VILQSGKWRFREEDVKRLMGIIRKRKKVVLYARVSSNTQKDHLINQVKYLTTYHIETPNTFGMLSDHNLCE